MGFSIVTYSNFESDTLMSGTVSAGILSETPVDYRGFALLTINNTFSYPLIIGNEDIHIDFTKPGAAPEIKEGDENRFFYTFYGAYNLLNSQLRFYNNKKNRMAGNDSLYREIVAITDSLNQEKELLVSGLPQKNYPVASAILQEKLLEESSWGIKSLDELHQKQKGFAQFASGNYPYLQHSQQLSALINQSFMMLEYINYYESIEKTGDKKTDIDKIKELLRSEMIDQTQLWIDALKPYVPEPVILAQCVQAFYNRSMTTKAMEIISAFGELAKCEGDGDGQINFPEAFDVVKGDGYTIINTHTLNPEKIIIMVDNECVFSKVLAIQAVREHEKSPIPIIILPKGKLDSEILALDKLCVKDLYFVKEKAWVNNAIMDGHKYPYYYKLGASNKVLTTGWAACL
ncbi:MAG: hypothetical protein GXO89_01255 [Chlorobi bacterium]|nr:hypothetical protein [Chlorobiota bacterium]